MSPLMMRSDEEVFGFLDAYAEPEPPTTAPTAYTETAAPVTESPAAGPATAAAQPPTATEPMASGEEEDDFAWLSPTPAQAEACAADLASARPNAPEPAPKTRQEILIAALDAQLPTFFTSKHEVGRILHELRPFYSRQGRNGNWRKFLRARGLAVSTANNLIMRYEEAAGLRETKPQTKRPKSGHFRNGKATEHETKDAATESSNPAVTAGNGSAADEEASEAEAPSAAAPAVKAVAADGADLALQGGEQGGHSDAGESEGDDQLWAHPVRSDLREVKEFLRRFLTRNGYTSNGEAQQLYEWLGYTYLLASDEAA